MQPQSFSAGDRVVYRDPDDPRNPLAGEVVAVTDYAISVRYDAHPHAPGLIGTAAAAKSLRPEQDAAQ